MSSFSKFVGGVLMGGALGALIGVLLAPRSGEETRALLQEEFNHQSSDLKHRVREAARHAKEDTLDPFKARAQETIHDSVEMMKARLAHLGEEAKRLKETLETAGNEALHKVAAGVGGGNGKSNPPNPEANVVDVEAV